MSGEQTDGARSVVGVWSDGVLFGPGGMSDWTIVFRPDGVGRVELNNPVTVNLWTFRWRLASPTVLRIEGESALGLDDANQVLECEWPLRKDVPFTVGEEVGKTGWRVRVLRLGEDFDDFIPSVFGLCVVDVAEYGEARFPPRGILRPETEHGRPR